MNEGLKNVAEFHTTFEHPILSPGESEKLSTRQLRIKLLFEELVELSEASDCNRTMYELCGVYMGKAMQAHDPRAKSQPLEVGLKHMADHLNEMNIHDGDNVDRLEELDALCDIRYVLDGKILTGGYHEIFDKNYEIVHQNNMTKAHNSFIHVEETVRAKGHNPSGYNYVQKGDKFLLFDKDGKLTKPHDHVKVKLEL